MAEPRFEWGSPESATRGGDRVSRCIQDHPDSSVLAALAAGVVVGVLASTLLAETSAKTSRGGMLPTELGNRLLSSIDGIARSSMSDLRSLLAKQ